MVLDEFHERHLAGDLALALLRRLQETKRPDLKLVVMSATLDAEPIAAFLGDAPRLRREGRRFDVAIEHLPTADDRPLDEQVLGGREAAARGRGLDGDVLVFLPGAAEIRRAQDALAEIAQRKGIELPAPRRSARRESRTARCGRRRGGRSSSPPTSPRPRSRSRASPR